MQNNFAKKTISSNRRITIWYTVLLLVVIIFIARLFYLQIIKHDHYHELALRGQLKQYKITPERGIIKVHDGTDTVPIVLNETLYTLTADPVYASKDATSDAQKLSTITDGDVDRYNKLTKTPN